MMPHHCKGSSRANVRSLHESRVFCTAQRGDYTMIPWGLPRRVLLLLCGAAVLLAGCVSKGKYTELESKYTELQGQYTTLQGQYQ
jgi:hypothetical protein